MPRTKAGSKALASFKKQYGAEEGKKRYYASIVKGVPGSSKWEGKGGTGKLEKAKRTYARKKKGGN